MRAAAASDPAVATRSSSAAHSIAPLAPDTPPEAELVVEPDHRRPLLSYIRGLPAPGLDRLFREYCEEAGPIEQFGPQVNLYRTAGAGAGMIAAASSPESLPIDDAP